MNEDDSGPCLLPGRELQAESPPSAVVKPEEPKAKDQCSDCWNDEKQTPRQKEVADKAASYCRQLETIDIEKSVGTFTVSMWPDGFEVVSMSGSSKEPAAKKATIRRYDADGHPTEQVSVAIDWTDEDQFVAGRESTLWVTPEKKEEGAVFTWKAACIKQEAPRRTVSFQGNEPYVVWHRGRFVIVFYKDGQLFSLVSNADCSFGNVAARAVGKVSVICDNESDESCGGPFISSLVSIRDSVGILTLKKDPRKRILPVLSTFELSGGRLKSLARTVVYPLRYTVKSLRHSLLYPAGPYYLAGVMADDVYYDRLPPRDLGSGRRRVIAHDLMSAKAFHGWARGEIGGFAYWDGGWYHGVKMKRGYAMQYTGPAFHGGTSDPVIVCKTGEEFTTNGAGLFTVVWDDDDDVSYPHRRLIMRPSGSSPARLDDDEPKQNRMFGDHALQKRIQEELDDQEVETDYDPDFSPSHVSLISCRKGKQ
jgi:hypothetical protein